MAVKPEILKLALNRMNITWEPDEKELENVTAAIEEAEALLRDRSGSKELDLTGPEYRGLLITGAWYIKNHMKAEFEADYRSEIISLRLVEGFGCGKENTV